MDVSPDDVKEMLAHLETEYRKANISDKHYKELKESYLKLLRGEVTEKMGRGTEEHEEAPAEENGEENIAGMPSESDEEPTDEYISEGKEVIAQAEAEEAAEKEEISKKKSLLGSIFKKKEKKETAAPQEKPVEGQTEPVADVVKQIKAEPPKPVAKLPVAMKVQSPQPQKKQDVPKKIPESAKIEDPKQRMVKKGDYMEVQEEKHDDYVEVKDTQKDTKKGKKEEEEEIDASVMTPEIIEKLARRAAGQMGVEVAPPEPEPETTGGGGGMATDIEIEKLKVLVDTIREGTRVTEETIRNVSESVGEIRSTVFQTDAELKETSIKVEKIEDEMADINPREFSKKMRELVEKIEGQQLEFEKIQTKSEDYGERINKVFELLKTIGGIENLINVNKDIQLKLNDVNEALKYIERIGSKTEKMFIDLNKGLEELILIKAKQEDFDDALKEVNRNMDGMNVKLEGFIAKKDMDDVKQDMIGINKQIEEMNKILPIADAKLPENITNYRKDKDDITMFLGSLEDQYKRGRVSKQEYESVKIANIRKLGELKANLENEWRKLEQTVAAEKDKAMAEVTAVKVRQDDLSKAIDDLIKKVSDLTNKVSPPIVSTPQMQVVQQEAVKKKSSKKKEKQEVKESSKSSGNETDRKRKILEDLKKLR